MGPIARAVSDEDVREAAAYFAAITPAPWLPRRLPKANWVRLDAAHERVPRQSRRAHSAPALYALAVRGGGYVLNRQWPLRLGDGVFITLAAWALTLAWLVLTVTSIGNFRRSRTSIIPVRPATALVIAGPDRFTRNPMYVGMAALTVALALFMDTRWPIVLVMPVLVIVRVFVIGPEERYLQRRFGAGHVAYMHRVRRWI